MWRVGEGKVKGRRLGKDHALGIELSPEKVVGVGQPLASMCLEHLGAGIFPRVRT